MNSDLQQGSRHFPKRLFLVLVGIITLALALSSIHTFYTLQNARTEYLENLARDLSVAVSRQVRGPGRRADLTLWQQVLGENLDQYSESVMLLALVDASGRVLASASTDFVGDAGTLLASDHKPDLFLFEHALPSGRGGPRWEIHSGPEAAHLIIGLDPSLVDFLSRQAYIHLLVSVAAVGLLWLTSGYLFRTSRRFLELKVKEESERHLATLGRMSATLAHEIRNPLGAMKGLTQLVREELPKEHSTQPMMKTVVSEAERLERLVTDLLSFAAPRNSELSSFRLGELVAEVIDFLQPEAAEHGVRIRLLSSRASPLRSDREGLRQVLLNLLKNAIEASGEKSEVEVEINQGKRDRWVVLSVRDQGGGLGAHDAEELFQPFKTTKMRGSGLGLPISRKIVEGLGGSLTLANRSDVPGAVCIVTIPQWGARSQFSTPDTAL